MLPSTRLVPELANALRLASTLSLIAGSFVIASAQDTIAAESTISAQNPVTITSLIPSSTLLTSTLNSAAGSFTRNGTSLTPSAQSPRPTSNDSAPLTSPPDDGDEDVADTRSGLINYYFVFLAIFVVLGLLGLYFVQKRRRAMKRRYQNSGQSALARDVNGWASTRRWMNGHWRSEAMPRPDEGLNELGQAPPPYAAKPQPRGPNNTDELSVPLTSLARNEGDRSTAKPPEYREAVRRNSRESSV